MKKIIIILFLLAILISNINISFGEEISQKDSNKIILNGKSYNGETIKQIFIKYFNKNINGIDFEIKKTNINKIIVPKIDSAINKAKVNKNYIQLTDVLIETKKYYTDYLADLSEKSAKVINGTGVQSNSINLIYESEKLSIGSAGKIIEDKEASGNKAIKASIKTEKPGTMQFGPYDSEDLIEGKEYIAKFRIKVGDNKISKYIGLVDIFDEKAKIRKYIEFSGTDFTEIEKYQEIEIPFIKKGFNTEYRLFFYGNSDITIDKVTIIEKKLDSNVNISEEKEKIDNNIEYFVATILLDGLKENTTTIEEMEKMRNQLKTIDSNLKVSWAMTNDFVFHEENRLRLKKVLEMVDKYGDEISVGYGFPNNKETLDSWILKMKEWIYMYRYNALTEIHVGGMSDDPKGVFESIPEKYRPTSVTTYAINHEQAEWVRENFRINSFMGWTATQYKVDQLSGEGSPLMSYWSNKVNPLVPSQNESDNSKSIFLNTITVDPIGCRYDYGESRWTIHPADPLNGGKNQIHTISQYMNNPYRENNTINYLSLFIDINWIYRDERLNKDWEYIINNWPKDKKTEIIGIKKFTNKLVSNIGNDNNKNKFTLLFRGSGEMNGIFVSPSDTQYLWTEDKTQRIILSKKDSEISWKIIDFTDYTKEITPLKYTKAGNLEDVSYITGRNYKLAPDFPLTQDEINRVKDKLIELKFNETITYK